MTPAIAVAIHALSSVYDSLAQDYTGDAKGELSSLIGLLEDWSDTDFPTGPELIAACEEATPLIRVGNKHQATRALLKHINALWKQVLD